jgi:hypothetical protein
MIEEINNFIARASQPLPTPVVAAKPPTTTVMPLSSVVQNVSAVELETPDLLEITTDENTENTLPPVATPETTVATPPSSSFTSKTLEFYSQRLQHFLASTEAPKDPLDREIAKQARTMLPKERAALKMSGEIGQELQTLIALTTKLEAERIVLESQTKSGELRVEPIFFQHLIGQYKSELDPILERNRVLVSKLYSESKTDEGQLVTGLVNKIEGLFKKITMSFKTLASTSGTSAQGKIDSYPIKHYLDTVLVVVQQAVAEHQSQVTAYGTQLANWEVQAFREGDTFWNKDERTTLVGITALYLKIRDEVGKLLSLYQHDISIGEEAELSFRTNGDLYNKVEKRVGLLQQQLQQTANPDKLDKITKSFSTASDALRDLQDLMNSAKGNITINRAELLEHYSQKLFDTGRHKVVEAPKPKESKTKKRREATGAQKIVLAITMSLAIVSVAYQLLGLVKSDIPKTFDMPAFKAIVPVKSMFSWHDWVFVDVEADYWDKLTPTERKKKAEALYDKAKEEGFKYIEIKNTKRKTVAITNTFGKTITLSVR